MYTWLYAYTYGSCSKSYTTWECLKIFGFSVMYVTVYMFTLSKWSIFSSINRNFNWWIFLIFGPGTAWVSSYPPFKWCSVCFGKMMWTLVCVQRYVCLCELIYTTYVWCMYIIYVYIYVCNLTDQEDLLDDDAHLSKDVDMHLPFQEGKDYGRRSSTFRWCERKDLKLFFPPNSYSGSPAVLSRSSGSTWTWWISSWVSYGTPSILWWCKDFGKKGPKKTPWCLTQCAS